MLAPEDARLIVAGGLGAAIRLYLRRPRHWVEIPVVMLIGIAAAFILSPSLDPYSPLQIEATGCIVGLCVIAMAEAILRAVEKLDVLAIMKKGKP